MIILLFIYYAVIAAELTLYFLNGKITATLMGSVNVTAVAFCGLATSLMYKDITLMLTSSSAPASMISKLPSYIYSLGIFSGVYGLIQIILLFIFYKKPAGLVLNNVFTILTAAILTLSPVAAYLFSLQFVLDRIDVSTSVFCIGVLVTGILHLFFLMQKSFKIINSGVSE